MRTQNLRARQNIENHMDQGEEQIKYDFVQHNIRGLISNYYNLQTLISIHKPDIICLHETQLGPNTTLKNSKTNKIYRL